MSPRTGEMRNLPMIAVQSASGARLRAARLAPLVALTLLLPFVGGCSKVQARAKFKEGNAFYKEEKFRAALESFQKGMELDPTARQVWRSVGLSALAVYRPGEPGEENARMADTAIAAFEKYLQANPNDAKVREYLLTTLINANKVDQALAALREEERKNPSNPDTRQAIVSLLIKNERFDEAMAEARKPVGARPSPVALYTVGVAHWQRAYQANKNPFLMDMPSRERAIAQGLEALEQAYKLAPDDVGTLAYINLLYREKAVIEPDPVKAQEWVAIADEWRNKAMELNKRKAAAAAAAKPSTT
jgi:tetratricopeptide (TPR) repeat protein